MATKTAVSRRSPARPRGAARRTALLEATLALVGEHGADAVTHRAVAQRAGLPLASTTYWFDSKEQLLTEALRHAADQDIARLTTAVDSTIAAADGPPSADAIVALMTEDDGCSDRGRLLAAYTLLLEAARRPALQAISERWSAAYLGAYEQLMQRAGSPHPADDARLLMAATDGLLIDRLATGHSSADHDPRPRLRRLVTALIPGVAR